MKRKEARQLAEQLVAQMTLEEKISQLRYDSPAIHHLNIPTYNWWNESLHGVARAGVATIFPQAIGLAATFDTELLNKIGDTIALEGRAKYNAYSNIEDRDIYKGLTFWAPNINIFRDPRWGRGQETYGEDPYLSGTLGKAYVNGLQGDGEFLKAAACAKHFAVHSGPEATRHEFNAEVSKKDLEETYLPAFEMLVKEAEVEAVMGAYNRVNGEPCCGSETLIKNILRERWGFKGHFVSDCWAIRDFHENHMVTNTPAESAAMAINAGCDLCCGITYLHLLNSFRQGLVTEETITESAVRLFTTRYLLGLFDKTEYDQIPYSVVECGKNMELSEEAARKGIVLLKNNNILPINLQEGMTIGVIGPNANSRASLVGNYHGTSSEYNTVLEGIKHYISVEYGEDVNVLYSEGCHINKSKTEALAWDNDRLAEAKIVAKHSDLVILCLGLDETLEGEEGDTGNSYASGDKLDLHLPESQRDLMKVLAESNTPVVLCVMTGSAIDLNFAEANYDGILQTWYPGARGGKALAEIIFGKYSPSGKLPVTFYESLEELPPFEEYSMQNRTYCNMEQLAKFPFGFGLTYGKVNVLQAEMIDQTHVQATLCNDSQIDVEEVVQVYIRPLNSTNATRNPRLCGYKRVICKAGEQVQCTISLWDKAFTVVNEDGERIIDSKNFEIYIGCSQPDQRSIELMNAAPIRIEYTLS